jgi:hypothetical protein
MVLKDRNYSKTKPNKPASFSPPIDKEKINKRKEINLRTLMRIQASSSR